jgi:hypothetical protein
VTDSTPQESSDSITITVSSSAHEVSTPNTPIGQANGAPDEIITFQTGGSICSYGHPVEYQFNWGDGTYSTWSSATNASHSWSTPGSYSVRARARCTLDNTLVSGWSSVKTVQITTSSSFNLTISAVTGGPAPGFGGVSYPPPGNYTYNEDSEVSLSAIPNNGYRFSKWTGDLNITKAYDEEITLSMDRDKDITVYFYTQCGDVNGDLAITPADSQDVFGIFLGTISDPTEAQKENADVNCDGTKTEPKITPADAQAIFENFLKISELPGDCSCKSRTAATGTSSIQSNSLSHGIITIKDIVTKSKKKITMPVVISNISEIKSFGFDLLYPSEQLKFIGIKRTPFTNDFNELNSNIITDGLIRVGGFGLTPIQSNTPKVLVKLIFQVIGEAGKAGLLTITNTVDALENVEVKTGRLSIQQ